MVRSALAVLAGFVAMALLVMIATALAVRFVLRRPLASMRSQDPGPISAAYLATNVTTSVLAALVGGYVTALLAERDRVAHGLVLAAVMVMMSVVSVRQSGPAQPRWYRILLLAGMPALAVVGATLCSSATASP
jgi:hypothetical protein